LYRASAVPRDKDGPVQKAILYSIAFARSDYREIAELNNIQNHGIIQLGRELRLPSASTLAVVKTMVESKPLEIPVKSQPKVAKLPYTEQAVAQIEKMQEDLQKSEPVMVAKVQAKPEIKPEAKIDVNADDGSMLNGSCQSGALISEFSGASHEIVPVTSQAMLPVRRVRSYIAAVVAGMGFRSSSNTIDLSQRLCHNDQLLVERAERAKAEDRGATLTPIRSTTLRYILWQPVDPANIYLVKSE
jgi:hypothetical protein